MLASAIRSRGADVGFLRPGRAASGPADPLARALDDLRRAGADPGQPHETRHFIYVPGVKPAQQLARSLQKPGRRVEVDTSSRRGLWLVVVIESLPITPETIGPLRAELEAAAASAGAEYDRWQVSIAAG
jgi:hypothetical protein